MIINNYQHNFDTQSRCRQSVIWLLIVSHLLFAVGCTTTHQLSIVEDQIPQNENAKILRVILKSGETVRFNIEGGRYIEKPMADKLYRAIVGVTVEGKVVEIVPEKAVDIQIETKSFNVVGTLLLGLFVISAAAFGLLVALLSGHSH